MMFGRSVVKKKGWLDNVINKIQAQAYLHVQGLRTWTGSPILSLTPHILVNLVRKKMLQHLARLVHDLLRWPLHAVQRCRRHRRDASPTRYAA
jgi:hypothetical protein